MELKFELNQGQLKIQVLEKEENLYVSWDGKSNERNPHLFLSPFFSKIIDQSKQLNKPIFMDFKKLKYMNSSTVTPIIQMLDKTKKEKVSFTVSFDSTKSWQTLNFQAMKIFENKTNPKIEIIS